MRTAFFGGTFDPVHTGHLSLAREVLKQGRADRVLFVPAPSPPHKEAECITAFEHRLAMVRLAIHDDSGFECSDIERHREGKSYTIDTLNELSAMKRYGEILLLIGSDSLRQLHLWFRCHDLVRDYGLIVYPRRNERAEREELLNYWSPAETEKLLDARMMSAPEFPVSSTQIRDFMRKNGIKGISAFVSPEVREYIVAHRLYS